MKSNESISRSSEEFEAMFFQVSPYRRDYVQKILSQRL